SACSSSAVGARRVAVLATLALLAAGCGSTSKTSTPLPVPKGPAGLVRVALADLLWPLDPARARNRDEIVVARALFATPLRTDPSTGDLRPGLCSAWHPSDGSRSWHFRCRDRKSTRLNSSHVAISYAVFCLKKKKSDRTNRHL